MDNNIECKINNSCVGEYLLKKETEFLKYEITYPKILIYPKYIYHNDYNKEIIQSINTIIYNDIIKFKYNLEKESLNYKQIYKNEDVKFKYEGYSNFDVTYDKNNLISIPVEFYEFTGGAHGMTYLESYNYDLDTGDQVLLNDLFNKGVDYKKIINDYIESYIEKNKEMFFEENEGFKGIKDNQEFYMTDDNLVVYFEIYEIAPYYVSIPKFNIPLKEIEQYLNLKYICIQ
ncbi:DUF3298 and DUF4163 domain-containing protein [Paraclostridium bifermentans]